MKKQMIMNERTAKLHKIMKDTGMNAEAVATLLGRKKITVLIWRCASDNRTIPADTLKVLEFETAKKAAK